MNCLIYFVSLTKHKRICHVFCLSSDSLFIERIYNEAMLDGRVDYILVDDFDKETALKFMDFLAKEVLNKELSEDDKELIYSYVGGKPKLIIRVINKLDRMGLREVLDNMLKDATQKIKRFFKGFRLYKTKGCYWRGYY